MFEWLFKKKKEIKPEDVYNIVLDTLDILKHLRETFVIASVSSLKTYSPELKKSKEWKVETLSDVPELEAALFAYQIICVTGFLIKHKINASNTQEVDTVNVIKEVLIKKKAVSFSDEIAKLSYSLLDKYLMEEDRKKTIQLLTDDAIKFMKFPKITEHERLRNGMYMTVRSMEAQVFMELARYFGDKKLADKYLMQAAKGLGV